MICKGFCPSGYQNGFYFHLQVLFALTICLWAVVPCLWLLGEGLGKQASFAILYKPPGLGCDSLWLLTKTGFTSSSQELPSEWGEQHRHQGSSWFGWLWTKRETLSASHDLRWFAPSWAEKQSRNCMYIDTHPCSQLIGDRWLFSFPLEILVADHSVACAAGLAASPTVFKYSPKLKNYKLQGIWCYGMWCYKLQFLQDERRAAEGCWTSGATCKTLMHSEGSIEPQKSLTSLIQWQKGSGEWRRSKRWPQKLVSQKDSSRIILYFVKLNV